MSEGARRLVQIAVVACAVARGASLCAAAEQGATIVPVQGERFSGRLLGVDADWNVRLRVGDEERQLPAADLVTYGALADPVVRAGSAAQGAHLVLADGGLLVADVLKTHDDKLKVYSFLFGEVDIPLERLSAVLFQPSSEPGRRDALLNNLLSDDAETDRLMVADGETLNGAITSVNESEIEFNPGSGPVKIKAARVAALAFNPKLADRAPRPGFRAMVGFSDGGRLLAASLVVDQGALRLKDTRGLTWETEAKHLVCLQPLGGRVTYLSDLKALDYRHIPFLSLAWPFHTDRNALGTSLRSRGVTYLKGLGLHSTSRVTYELKRPYRRFEADAAIDEASGELGSVTFRVYVDGEQRYRSPTVRGGAAPTPVSVDLSGARRMSLVVDFAERGDEQDQADWLNARLIP